MQPNDNSQAAPAGQPGALDLAPGSASVFAPLEAQLSEVAKAALMAYFMGFAVGDPAMTVRELRTYIRRIFGEDADRELEQHLAARRAAVLPSPNTEMRNAPRAENKDSHEQQ